MEAVTTQTFDTPRPERVSKVIQIHPSLQCNLTCRHCYSTSGPSFKAGLDVYTLQQRTEELAAVGYNAISLSGGEPFLYNPLEELLVHTHRLGLFNSITTNAMLLRTDRAKKILQQADLVAISIDGKQAQHDRLRNQAGAFQKMEEGVNIIKDHVANFGFIHTLFPQNWEIISWLVHFAMDHKAGLLHLHPLELFGRAGTTFQNLVFDAVSLHKIYIAFHVLNELYGDKLLMQLDLLHREHIIDNPAFVIHDNLIPNLIPENFSCLFKEIIIEETGDIMPIAHGCSPYFRLGNIYDRASIREMINQFMEEKMEGITRLYQATLNHIVSNNEIELVNWSEVVVQFSHALFGAPIVNPASQFSFA